MSKLGKPTERLLTCRHCGNYSYMDIVASGSRDIYYMGEFEGAPSVIECSEIVECPKCQNLSVRGYYFDDGDPESYGEGSIFLYPEDDAIDGMPPELDKLYRSSILLRNDHPTACLGQLRRLLEAICAHQGADTSQKLHKQIVELSDSENGTIPKELVDVAMNLKIFGNEAVHYSDEIAKDELEVALDLLRALLEYLYGAPHLVERARSKLVERGVMPATKQESSWTKAEITLLLLFPSRSNKDMEQLIPNRSARSINRVRKNFHEYHLDPANSKLSRKIKNLLAESGFEAKCHKCGAAIS